MLKRGFLFALIGVSLVMTSLLYQQTAVSYAAVFELPVATYVVQSNDTLKSIAARYGIDVSNLIDFNSLSEPYPLWVGMELLIPLGDASVPVPDPSAAVDTPAPDASSIQQDSQTTATGIAPSPVEAERSSGGASFRGGPRDDMGVIWPVHGLITQRFMEEGHHKGIDISAPQGTPVVAMKGGDVQLAAYDNSGYGNCVIVSHPDGSSTLYSHLSRFAVMAGDHVEQSQLLGYVGVTGIATGPHLHFEVHQGTTLVDPLSVLP